MNLTSRDKVALKVFCAMIANPESFGSDIQDSEDWKGVDDPELYKHMATTAFIAADSFLQVAGATPGCISQGIGEKFDSTGCSLCGGTGKINGKNVICACQRYGIIIKDEYQNQMKELDSNWVSEPHGVVFDPSVKGVK